MRKVTLTKESTRDILENLLKRSPNNYGKFEAAVADILTNVQEKGDEALFSYTKEFDKYLKENLIRNIDTEKYAFFSWISINGFIYNIVQSNIQDKELVNKLIDEYLDFMILGIFKNN